MVAALWDLGVLSNNVARRKLGVKVPQKERGVRLMQARLTHIIFGILLSGVEQTLSTSMTVACLAT